MKGPLTWNCELSHYSTLNGNWLKMVDCTFSFTMQRNADKDQVKAAIKAQQDQQIDNASILAYNIVHFFCSLNCWLMTLVFTSFFWQALLAEGRFYSDLELTEKEIERSVMEASRAEYLAGGTLKHQRGHRESSTSTAEPSSSGAS